MRKLLILDCDGVLYPPSNIDHEEFVSAFRKAKEFFYPDFPEIEADGIKDGSVFWNTIYRTCKNSGLSFEDFCRNMVSNINYGKIRKGHKLLKQLLEVKEKYDIVVLSDNHKYHLERVLQKRFNMGIAEFCRMGISCYDITSTEDNGVFWPKNTSKALINFCKKQNRKIAECIFVDNNMNNIKAVKNIGMPAVYINKKLSLKRFLHQINK